MGMGWFHHVSRSAAAIARGVLFMHVPAARFRRGAVSSLCRNRDLQLQFIHTLTHANFYSSRSWIYEGLAHFAQITMREQQDGRKPG